MLRLSVLALSLALLSPTVAYAGDLSDTPKVYLIELVLVLILAVFPLFLTLIISKNYKNTGMWRIDLVKNMLNDACNARINEINKNIDAFHSKTVVFKDVDEVAKIQAICLDDLNRLEKKFMDRGKIISILLLCWASFILSIAFITITLKFLL